MNPSRWPDTGRFRSAFQTQSWLWFFNATYLEGTLMNTVAAQRELPRAMRRPRRCKR